MENFASPSSPKKAPASIADPLICWNCHSFRVLKLGTINYEYSCANCGARGSAEEFRGNPDSARIVNRRGRRIA